MTGIDENFDPGKPVPDPNAVKISSEVMVAAVVFLFMVVVFVFFLYLYAKYYLRPSHGRRSRAGFLFAAADLGPAPRSGLDTAVLRSLPVTVYRAADFKEEGLECAVCLSNLADGEEARLLPKCNHGFHLECIDMWFHSHSTCPLCRTPVVGEKQSPDEETPASPAEASAEDSPAEFPTNVLVWGGQDRARSQEGPSSSAGALAIEIPRKGMEGFPSPCSPLPSSRMAMEDAKSPASARFGPLRRLWSMGKRTPGASSSPREGDIEQGLEGGAPKSPAN